MKHFYQVMWKSIFKHYFNFAFPSESIQSTTSPCRPWPISRSSLEFQSKIQEKIFGQYFSPKFPRPAFCCCSVPCPVDDLIPLIIVTIIFLLFYILCYNYSVKIFYLYSSFVNSLSNISYLLFFLLSCFVIDLHHFFINSFAL